MSVMARKYMREYVADARDIGGQIMKIIKL